MNHLTNLLVEAVRLKEFDGKDEHGPFCTLCKARPERQKDHTMAADCPTARALRAVCIIREAENLLMESRPRSSSPSPARRNPPT